MLERKLMDMEQSDSKKNGQEIGSLFAVVALAIGLFPLLDEQPAREFWILSAFYILVVAVLFPRLLSPVHKVWMRFAHLLSKITTPLILGILFSIVFVPVSLWWRITGKDPLGIGNVSRKKESFWIKRDDRPSTVMTKQF